MSIFLQGYRCSTFPGIFVDFKINIDAKIIAITGDMGEKTQKKLEEYNIPILYKPYDISTIEKVFVE